MAAEVLTPSRTRTVTKTVSVKVEGLHVPRGADDFPPPTSHAEVDPEPPPIPQPEQNSLPQNAQPEVDPGAEMNPFSEQNPEPPPIPKPEQNQLSQNDALPERNDLPTNHKQNSLPVFESMPLSPPILLQPKPKDESVVEFSALQKQLQELVCQLDSQDAELLRMTATNRTLNLDVKELKSTNRSLSASVTRLQVGFVFPSTSFLCIVLTRNRSLR